MVVVIARRVIVVAVRRGERSNVRILRHRLHPGRSAALRHRPTTTPTNRHQRQTNHRERYKPSRHGRKIYGCSPSERTCSESTLARCLARQLRHIKTTRTTADNKPTSRVITGGAVSITITTAPHHAIYSGKESRERTPQRYTGGMLRKTITSFSSQNFSILKWPRVRPNAAAANRASPDDEKYPIVTEPTTRAHLHCV